MRSHKTSVFQYIFLINCITFVSSATNLQISENFLQTINKNYGPFFTAVFLQDPPDLQSVKEALASKYYLPVQSCNFPSRNPPLFVSSKLFPRRLSTPTTNSLILASTLHLLSTPFHYELFCSLKIIRSSVFILLQKTNLYTEFGKFVPKVSYLVNHNRVFRLCLFCNGNVKHGWIQDNQYSSQIKATSGFNRGPMCIKNVHWDPAILQRIPQEYFNTKITSRELSGLQLNIKAFLPVSLQKQLNISIILCKDPLIGDVMLKYKYFPQHLGFTFYDYGDFTQIKFMGLRLPKSGSWNWLTGTLDYSLILLFGGSLAITSAFLYAFQTYKSFNIFECSELLFGISMGQNAPDSFNVGLKFRICLLSWIFFCFIIMEYYKGDLAGNFTKPTFIDGSKTFENLLASRTQYFVQPYKIEISQNETEDCPGLNSLVASIMQAEAMQFRNVFLAKILYGIVKCRSQSPDYYDAYKRIGTKNEVFFAEIVELNGVRRTLAAGDVYFSSDSILSRLYIFVMKNLFEEDVVNLLNKFMYGGILQKHLEIHREQQQRGIIHDIREGIRNSLEKESRNQRKLNNGENAGPKTLKFSHIETFIMLIGILLGVSSLIAILECSTMFRRIKNRVVTIE